MQKILQLAPMQILLTNLQNSVWVVAPQRIFFIQWIIIFRMIYSLTYILQEARILLYLRSIRYCKLFYDSLKAEYNFFIRRLTFSEAGTSEL